MQFLHEIKMKESNYPLPRVLGMTATIIMGNCEPSEVPDRVAELERTMQAKAVTYKDYEAVLRLGVACGCTRMTWWLWYYPGLN